MKAKTEKLVHEIEITTYEVTLNQTEIALLRTLLATAAQSEDFSLSRRAQCDRLCRKLKITR